ncbi:MAG: hypothetical protein HKN50_07805 [Gammaproteobacteria bacterium]|nr:hypothetical protein [Gammaproteobacteria bacterium]
MKYFGQKSLSSVLSVLFAVAWYVILVFGVVGLCVGFYLIAASSGQNPADWGADMQGEDWEHFSQMPGVFKMVFFVYGAVLLGLILKIVKKSQALFSNFKNDLVFDQANVTNLSNIGKLMVWFAVLTLNIFTLFVSLLLLMLCEIFKSGATLQEEHDLTV